jgi:hypothetical protein
MKKVDKFLKVYRMLNDSSVVSLLDITPDQGKRLQTEWDVYPLDGFEAFLSPDQELLLKFRGDEYVIYENPDVFKKILSIGVKSSSLDYFMYCPTAEQFISKKEVLINELLNDLEMPSSAMDYSLDSLRKLERALMEYRFQTRQEVEYYYMHILAYCGETVCRTYKAKWYFKSEDTRLPDRYWEPLIEISPGLILDSFSNLHENLFVYGDDHFLPMIYIVTDEALAKKK